MIEELEPKLLALEQHLSKYNFPNPSQEWIERTAPSAGKSRWWIPTLPSFGRSPNLVFGLLQVAAVATVSLAVVGVAAYHISVQTAAMDPRNQVPERAVSFFPADYPKSDVEIKLNPFRNYDGLSRNAIAEQRRKARKAYPTLEKLLPKGYSEEESPLIAGIAEELPWHRFDRVTFIGQPDTKPLTYDSLALENPYLLANLQYHYAWMNLDKEIPAHQQFVDKSVREMTPVKLKLHSKERRLEIKYRFLQERGYCYYSSYHFPDLGGAMFRLNCPNAYDFGFKWIVVDYAKCKGIRADTVRFDTLRGIAIKAQPVVLGVNREKLNCLDCTPVTSPLICLDRLPAHISAKLFSTRPKDKDQPGDLNLTVDIEAAPSMKGNTNFLKIREERLKVINNR